LVAGFLLIYPVYVIWPFRYQGPKELLVALGVLRVRMPLQVLLAIVAIGCTVWIWKRRGRVIGRIVAVLLAVMTIGFAVLSRINLYELMFHPLSAPVFAAAAKSKLDGVEQVIAVKVQNTARAYPIRILSYHHMVNDYLAGLPIVATY
jgi:hypothetical protein